MRLPGIADLAHAITQQSAPMLHNLEREVSRVMVEIEIIANVKCVGRDPEVGIERFKYGNQVACHMDVVEG
jgi:hypothetical protein